MSNNKPPCKKKENHRDIYSRKNCKTVCQVGNRQTLSTELMCWKRKRLYSQCAGTLQQGRYRADRAAIKPKQAKYDKKEK